MRSSWCVALTLVGFAGLIACEAETAVNGTGSESAQGASGTSGASGYNTSSSSGTSGGSSSSGASGSSGTSGYSSSSSGTSGYTPPKPECEKDDDCAFRDNDEDGCTKAVCRYNRCQKELVKNTAECQCHEASDCTYYTPQRECNTVACTSHKCIETILPAGPAPKQTERDCGKAVCDGVASSAKREFDAADLPDDNNPCTVDSCDATKGSVHTNVGNGTACTTTAVASGICFEGACLPCKPQNASSCGGEGDNEPTNNTGTTPATYAQQKGVCGFSNASDIDWYTFEARDGSWSYDVFNFTFWSTAALMEACIYVSCSNGATPTGGCALKQQGPNGSLGCCWTGAPNTLKPSWDMRCGDTGADSGTAYVSVRTPGGRACESYAMKGGY